LPSAKSRTNWLALVKTRGDSTQRTTKSGNKACRFFRILKADLRARQSFLFLGDAAIHPTRLVAASRTQAMTAQVASGFRYHLSASERCKTLTNLSIVSCQALTNVKIVANIHPLPVVNVESIIRLIL